MPNAVTTADIEDLLGYSLTASDARVTRLITRAEDIVAGDMPGFTFGEVDDATVTLDADGDELLLLPYYPVRSVASVSVGGTALVAGDWSVDDLGTLRRTSSVSSTGDGALSRWPDRGTDIVVVYSYGAGATSTPGEVAAVVAELAAGRVANPTQAAQESLGDRSISFGSSGATGDDLSAGQRRRLRHWRRHRFASARVRS